MICARSRSNILTSRSPSPGARRFSLLNTAPVDFARAIGLYVPQSVLSSIFLDDIDVPG
jgi:hypothetical protein